MLDKLFLVKYVLLIVINNKLENFTPLTSNYYQIFWNSKNTAHKYKSSLRAHLSYE